MLRRKIRSACFAYGQKYENPMMIASSSVTLMGDYKSVSEVQNSGLYSGLKDNFKKLNQSQKSSLLEEFDNSGNIAIAHSPSWKRKIVIYQEIRVEHVMCFHGFVLSSLRMKKCRSS